jgi:hypothetical protein
LAECLLPKPVVRPARTLPPPTPFPLPKLCRAVRPWARCDAFEPDIRDFPEAGPHDIAAIRLAPRGFIGPRGPVQAGYWAPGVGRGPEPAITGRDGRPGAVQSTSRVIRSWLIHTIERETAQWAIDAPLHRAPAKPPRPEWPSSRPIRPCHPYNHVQMLMLNVRLTVTEHAVVRQRATELRLTMSELVRRLVLAEALDVRGRRRRTDDPTAAPPCASAASGGAEPGPRSSVLNVRLTVEELIAFRRRAAAMDTDISVMVRRLVRAEAWPIRGRRCRPGVVPVADQPDEPIPLQRTRRYRRRGEPAGGAGVERGGDSQAG